MNRGTINKSRKDGNKKWYRLDNAATIVPATARGADTRVFRVVCELKEQVDPAVLQEALDLTAEGFPHFNVYLRKGLFWYYLDGTDKRVIVEKENREALAPLYVPGRRNLLYRVFYFERRINLEMFHVLSDGTGAFLFFRRLILTYLSITKGTPQGELEGDISSIAEQEDDAFRHFYSKQPQRSQLNRWMKVKAYQIKSPQDENMQSRLVEGIVSAKAFLALAKERHTTAGVFIVALYIEAVMASMSLQDRKKPIVISVPVNLRQFFPSATTRNFFGAITIGFDPSTYDGDFGTLVKSVKDSFAEQLTKDNIQNNMNSYSELKHMAFIKMLPLFIKDLGIQYYTGRTRRGTTSTLSNVGKVELPKEAAQYIDHFSGFMCSFNVQLCVVTFEDRMSFGAVSVYEDHQVLMNLFRKLTEMGLEVELATNDFDRV